MKYKIHRKSSRGKLVAQIDKLIFEQLKKERGHICEIHNRQCANIGPMHILSKQAHPKLRFHKFNIILAGWFCSHFWMHHNPDDKRAVFTKEKIEQLRGEDCKERLLAIEVIQPKHTMTYLNFLLEALKKNFLLKTLNHTFGNS